GSGGTVHVRQPTGNRTRGGPAIAAGHARRQPPAPSPWPGPGKRDADNPSAKPAPQLHRGPAGIISPAPRRSPAIRSVVVLWSVQTVPPVSGRKPDTHSRRF